MSVDRRAVLELARTAREVIDAGFVCAPELWRRLDGATSAIESQLRVPCEHGDDQDDCRICQRTEEIELQRDCGDV